MSTNDVSSTSEVSKLIQALNEETANALKGLLSGAELVPFSPTGRGEFPFHFMNSQHPEQFNYLTYEWISTLLAKKPSSDPVVRFADDPFTNQFIEAIGKVKFNLSKADEATLDAARKKADQESNALQDAWQATYGSLPKPSSEYETVADAIVNYIAANWAYPKTDSEKMQKSTNLDKLLNRTPASGHSIRPILAKWLFAMGDSISLQNQLMNNNYLKIAMEGVQLDDDPKVAAKRGVESDDAKVKYIPEYRVSPQVKTIFDSLDDTSKNTIATTLTLSYDSENTTKVEVNNGSIFRIPWGDFLTVEEGERTENLASTLVTKNSKTTIKMTFTGCNVVDFHPQAFDMSTNSGWAWFDPIKHAHKNWTEKKKDVTGFCWATEIEPDFDFSNYGDFGYTQGVAISNYPEIEITVVDENYSEIANRFHHEKKHKVVVLGMTFADDKDENLKFNKDIVKESKSLTIRLSQPKATSPILKDINKSLAWVLGAFVHYPCA